MSGVGGFCEFSHTMTLIWEILGTIRLALNLLRLLG